MRLNRLAIRVWEVSGVKAATPLQDMPTTNPEQKNAHLKAADDLIHTTPDVPRGVKSWTRYPAAITVQRVGSAVSASSGDMDDAAAWQLTPINGGLSVRIRF